MEILHLKNGIYCDLFNVNNYNNLFKFIKLVHYYVYQLFKKKYKNREDGLSPLLFILLMDDVTKKAKTSVGVDKHE